MESAVDDKASMRPTVVLNISDQILVLYTLLYAPSAHFFAESSGGTSLTSVFFPKQAIMKSANV